MGKLELCVLSKGGSQQDAVSVAPDATLADLKRTYRPKVSPHRKAFKMAQGEKSITLSDDTKTLASMGVTNGAQLTYKDLGPQIGYRTVFVVEYAGPLAFILLYATRPSLIYGAGASEQPLGEVQKLFCGLFAAHFVKRELETFFVHKFSRPTMPLFNIFKNSAYYWSFAACIGYFLCHPKYTPPTHGLEKLAAGAMCVFELGNFLVHHRLANMRSGDGDTKREAPKGGLFTFVSCPNYTFEIMSWVAFSAGTNIGMSWAFTLVGFLQMTDWALKKHRGYVKNEPQLKRRKAILPFII